MRVTIESPSGLVSKETSIRKPGVDFDSGGSRSTLAQMLQLGGLFPLAKIADRLPFPESTLRRWARKGPFADCFMHIHTPGHREPVQTLIHLDRIDERFCDLAQQSLKEDEEAYLTEVVSFLGEAGNLAV